MSTFSMDELGVLLGRPARAHVGVTDRMALAGHRVLVTGAGGSIGAELAREIAASRPAALGLLDHSELALFSIEREIRQRWPDVALDVYLSDVTRRAAVRRACALMQPDAIYHAAAYKHVTMAERAPAAACAVNVIGAIEVASAAARSGARYVFISSDKAADPRSVMGAAKRLAERAVLAMATRSFRPLVVRFGNVLGSSGSVVEVMRECVRAGQPVSLTDPDATRYFMTAAEAVALVFRADALGRSAEICWLEMGRPVRMADLVARLLALESALGYPAVPIQVVGLRPGEKRNETLRDRRLRFERSIDRRIRVARDPEAAPAELARAITRLRQACARADDRGALGVLTSAVDGFVPSDQALASSRPASRVRHPARDTSRRKRSAA